MSATLHVVIATIGEWSDRAEWPVCYYAASEHAEAYVLFATASAREIEEQWRNTVETWERANPEPKWGESGWDDAYTAWCEARPHEPLYPMEPKRHVSIYDELRYYVRTVPPGPELP